MRRLPVKKFLSLLLVLLLAITIVVSTPEVREATLTIISVTMVLSYSQAMPVVIFYGNVRYVLERLFRPEAKDKRLIRGLIKIRGSTKLLVSLSYASFAS